MTIKKGDRLPDVTFMTTGEDGPVPVTTKEYFGGKRVALFAVPGAYTPTCSAKHLPNFKDRATDLAKAGFDKIACTSVNDIFVLGAWSEQQEANAQMDMLADGNGEFAKALGLVLDGTGFGMGQRSQRYGMVVNDGVVEAVHVEDGGEYKVSSADYMLENL